MGSHRYYHAGDVLMACLMIAVVVFAVLAVVSWLVAEGQQQREIFSLAAYILLGVVCLSPIVSLLFGRMEGKDPPIKWFKKRGEQ